MGPLPGRPRVAVVFRYIHHYRLPFYELLRTELDRRGVDFTLVYGQPGPHEAAKDDAVEVAWATRIRNRYLVLGSRDVCWQPCLREVRGADLVVVEQASRLAATWVLLGWRRFGGPRVALWGQGRNVQIHRASRAAEWAKGLLTRMADWFFAYSGGTLPVLEAQGFPADRVTVVQNAVDTRQMSGLRASATPDQLESTRRRLGVRSEDVGVFAGALYEDKRLPFLVAAAEEVRRALPDFELLVIGTGDGLPALREAAVPRPWLHVLGPLYGEAKARAMLLAKVQLLPGAVGLGILDGFALGLPLVTTRAPFQGQEIEYLRDGVDGIMVDDWQDPAAYSSAIVGLLRDTDRLDAMSAACREAAGKYTVEAMAVNFADGVQRALEVSDAR